MTDTNELALLMFLFAAPAVVGLICSIIKGIIEDYNEKI